MKHTPGPWTWRWPEGELDPPQLEGNIEYADQNPILVSRGCSPSCMKHIGKPCPLVPNEEDRNLIAAAPDLLDACRSCMVGLENGKGSIPFMISMLRGAIARAEGKT